MKAGAKSAETDCKISLEAPWHRNGAAKVANLAAGRPCDRIGKHEENQKVHQQKKSKVEQKDRRSHEYFYTPETIRKSKHQGMKDTPCSQPLYNKVLDQECEGQKCLTRTTKEQLCE